MGSKAVISAVFAIGAVVVSACGGIDEPDLFSSGGASSSSGDAGGASSKDGGNSVVGADGGGSSRDSGGGGGGSDAGGGGIDSGGGSGGRSIFCGDDTSSTTCTGSDICCERNNTLGNGGLESFACDTESNCTGDTLGDLVIACDDARDCKGGNICCGVFVGGTTATYYTSVSCQPTCADTADRIFCDPARGNDDCVNGGSCVESGSLPGYHVCSS